MGRTDWASHRRVRGRTVDAVDNRAEVREFLVSHRAKITPEQAGVPTHGQRRVTLAAEPGSPTAHALTLLATWAATTTSDAAVPG